MTNATIRSINRRLAKITKRMPVNVTVTKKPSKLQTALTIIGGLAMYAAGVGIMMKANEPVYYPMPAFTFPIPEIKPIVDEDETETLRRVLREMSEENN